jgi:chromosome segregation ATPase
MRLFGGRRRTFGHGKELGRYRNELHERTQRIDARLAEVAEEIEALRRRDIDPETAISRLTAHEEELENEAEGIQDVLAPQELHGLHMEYEANLERSLRGILVVERGCAITRLPHRPPEDEEPYTYYKRGAGNVTHARMRMAEIVEVLLTWEPGQPAEATVASRLERAKRT